MGISNVSSIEFDVTNIDSIKDAKQELENKTGSLNVLINNAGIARELPQNIYQEKQLKICGIYLKLIFLAQYKQRNNLPVF